MNTALADRMKSYEYVNRTYLPIRLPVIIRIDGKNFSHYTKPFKRPYDDIFLNAMRATAAKLCENVGGTRLAYTQSDEISLLLIDYEYMNSQPWFDNNVQKLASVTASMASCYFSKALEHELMDYEPLEPRDHNYVLSLWEHIENQYPIFDSRCFVLPKEEVINYFNWRQKDCTRNSIMSAARYYCSAGEVKNKNGDQLQELMFEKAGINWNDYPTYFKRGSCIVKKEMERCGRNPMTGETKIVTRSIWIEDKEIPSFTQDPSYINDIVLL